MKKQELLFNKRNILLSSLFVLFVFLSGCSKSNSYGSSTNTGNPGGNTPSNAVTIQGMAFNPSSLTVPVNTTVTWTNKDATTHTVTSDTGLFDSGNINANGMYSYKFTTAGTFKYHCSIHPYMTATVIVQ